MTFVAHCGAAIGALTFRPLWDESGIPLAITGILIVFLALVLVAAFITLLPRLLARLPQQEAPRPRGIPPSPEDPELTEEKLALIAAAVAATVATPHRIVRIRGGAATVQGWTLEGRLTHHQSHGGLSRGRH